jgi:hypothetical protein
MGPHALVVEAISGSDESELHLQKFYLKYQRVFLVEIRLHEQS